MKELTQGQLLAREVDATLRQFIYAPDEYSYTAMAAFVLHSHMRAKDGEFLPAHTARLALLSKEAGCGKSLALKIVTRLSYSGELISKPTEAGMVTLINQVKASVGFDEIDRFFGRTGRGRDDMMNIINLGYEKEGGNIIRQSEGTVDRQNVHAPMALAGKNLMSFQHAENWDTVRSRSIVIGLERKPRDAYVDTYDVEIHSAHLRELMEQLQDWGHAHGRDIVKIDVNEIIPGEIINRDREIWRVFFRIAQHLGDGWPERVEKAARFFVLGQVDAQKKSISPSQEVLSCVRAAFEDDDEFLSTDDLVFRLKQDGPLRPSIAREWKTLTSGRMGLSRMLKIHDVESSRPMINGEQHVGYTREALDLPPVAVKIEN